MPDPILMQIFTCPARDRAANMGGPKVQHLVDAEIQLALEADFFEEAA